MTDHLIGIGTGLDIGDLVPFIVEPQCPDGVQAAQRDYGADYSVYEQGLFCVLLWPVIDGEDDLQALLAQMALNSFLRQAVTAYLPDFQRDFHVYSGFAIRPQVISFALWPTNLRVVLNNLTRQD